jgi:hypothetical protein
METVSNERRKHDRRKICCTGNRKSFVEDRDLEDTDWESRVRWKLKTVNP